MCRPSSAVVAALLLLPALSVRAQVARDTTLANGLQVYVAESHRVPEAMVTVVVRTGAFTQDAKQDGVAHMYEHLLFHSYPRGMDALNRETYNIDGGYNGETTADYVDFYMELPSSHVADAIKILGRLVRNARFSESNVKAERPIVLDELARDASTLRSRIERQVLERLWGQSWSRVDVGGDSATVSGLSPEILQSQYSIYYVPNNVALIVSGDVSAKDVWKAAADVFGDWPRGPEPPAPGPYPPLERSSFLLLAAPVPDVTVIVASQGPSYTPSDSDAVPVDLLTGLINQPASAFQSRLVGNGLFTSVTASYQGHRHDGTIEIAASAPLEHGQQAVLALLNELEVIDGMSGITEEDIGYARRALVVAEAINDQDPHRLAEDLASWWGGPGIGAYDAYDRQLATLHVSDVARVAAKYVVQRPHVVGILAPRPFLEALRARLASGNGGQP